jgi:hypothetical protein
LLQKLTKLTIFELTMPDLLAATRDYWRKLDEVEAAYKRGELSVEEVDNRVHKLMDELGRERRATLNFLFQNIRRLWDEQREILIGVGFLVLLTYAWFVSVPSM